MGDDFTTSMSLPFDDDGFLRRECPTCEEEFKVFVQQGDSDQSDAQSPQLGGYFCPYCAIQAEPDGWFTKAQIAKARSLLIDEFVGPELEAFKRRMSGHPGVSVEVEVNRQPTPDLTEADDMRRVDVACHPETPVKVLESYAGTVHCFICGAPA